jgi:hypothetical protein
MSLKVMTKNVYVLHKHSEKEKQMVDKSSNGLFVTSLIRGLLGSITHPMS